MHAVVAGSSGLIGSALVASLLADGHTVTRLVRRPARPTGDGSTEARWDPRDGEVDTAAFADAPVDAFVNLAGAGVADKRWTAAYKQELRDSRVLGTRTLAATAVRLAAANPEHPPAVFLNGSAIGYYGPRGDEVLTEQSPAGDVFLARLAAEWEDAAGPAAEAGIRTVLTRSGLVVSREGGAWGRLFPLFKAGLGGRLGDGSQYWSFVSLEDEVAALRFLLDRDDLSGPFNITAPNPATNRETTAVMGSLMGRPTLATVPAPVLRVVLGESASDIMASQRVRPERLLAAGFEFRHPQIADAVRAALDED